MPNKPTADDATKKRVVMYGRRKGRRLRAKKAELYETLLPQLSIPKEDAPLDPQKLFAEKNFASKKEIWLEVGFGGGEHLAAQAHAHPECGFVGCEPFINGVASLLEHVDAKKLSNVRIYADDARLLLARLPDKCLSKIFVLFPDPWPKKRHAERRFIGPANLPLLARVLKKGGELRIASDDPILQEWMIGHMQASPDFSPAPATQGGIYAKRPASWPHTRYETKSLAKKKYEGWQGALYYSFLCK